MLRELLRIWPTLDVKRLDQTFPRWFPLALRIINEHHAYSAVVAQRFVEEMRLSAEVTGSWAPPSRRPLDTRKIQVDLYRAAIITLKQAIAKQQAVKEARDRAFVVSAGTATSESMDGGRDMVIDSVAVDPRAVGWYRVTDADPCSFCAMLAARGIRYKTQASASFHPPPNCGCTAAPAYTRDAELPPVSNRAADVYDSATEGFTGKDKIRAFRRAWEHRTR